MKRKFIVSFTDSFLEECLPIFIHTIYRLIKDVTFIDRHDLKIDLNAYLGEGAFGKVFSGQLTQHCTPVNNAYQWAEHTTDK
jgi:hypothetical protein